MQVADVRAVITGAASGLGKEFTLRCLEAGAWVYAGDIDSAELRYLRREASRFPGRLFVQQVDAADEISVAQFVCQARTSLERMNTAIHSAGILRDGLLVSKVDGEIRKMNTTQWRQVIDVNLFGAFYLGREAAAVMLEQNTPGLILNISSVCRSGNAGQSNYSASKAAMDAATRSWALELGPHGIRVAALAPGIVETPMLECISEHALQCMKANVPLGRFGTVSDMWTAARFVIECEYFTGRVLEVDGGGDPVAVV